MGRSWKVHPRDLVWATYFLPGLAGPPVHRAHTAPVDYERRGLLPHVCSSSKVSVFSLGSDPLGSGEGCHSASLSVFPPCSPQESRRRVPSIHQCFTDFLLGLSVDLLTMESLVVGGAL